MEDKKIIKKIAKKFAEFIDKNPKVNGKIIAEFLGKSTSTISMYKKGERPIPIADIYKISTKYNIPPEWFFGISDQEFTPKKTSEYEEIFKQIEELYKKIGVSEDKIKILEEQVKFFLKIQD